MSLSPVEIAFHVRNMDGVLKAIKSIGDAVTKAEKKSTAAASMGTSEREKIAKREVTKAVNSWAEVAKAADKANKAGLHALEMAERRKLAIRERSATMAGTYYKKVAADEARISEASRARQHAGSVDYWKKEIAEADKAATRIRNIRERSATMAGSFAKSQVSKEAQLARSLNVARNLANYDIMRGGVAPHPSLRPQARLALLNSAAGKSPEEQQSILSRVHDMRARGQIDSKKRSAAAKEQKAIEDAATAELAAAEKRRIAMKERSATEMGRIARRQANKDAAEARKGAAEARRNDRAHTREQKRTDDRFANNVYGAGGSSVRGVGSIAARAATGLLSFGGGIDVQEAIQSRLNLERDAAYVSNEAITAKNPTRVDPKVIEEKVRASATKANIDPAEAMKGLRTYTARSADYAGGIKNLDFFGKMAKATGTDINEVMGTAGILRIQNPDLDDKAMKKLMLQILGQTREGSVEFKDMAHAGGKLTRSAISYSGDQAENQGKLMGLTQIGMRTAGMDPAEAGTMMANLASDATTHHAEVRNLLGHEFKDDKGRIMGGPDKFLGDLMEAAMSKPGGLDNLTNDGGIGKRVFGQRSTKLFQALGGVYTSAEKKALDNNASKKDAQAAGAKAVREDMAHAIHGSKYDEKALDKDFAAIMQTSAEQFEKAVRDFKAQLADKLTPVVKELVPLLQRLIEPLSQALTAFARIASWAADNPMAGLSTAIGISFAKELALAQIGEQFKTSLKNSLALGGATLAITATTVIIEQLSNADTENQKKDVRASLAATNALSGLHAGKTSAKSAQAVADNLKERIDEADSNKSGVGGTAVKSGAMFGSFLRDLAAGGGSVTTLLRKGGQKNIDEMKEVQDLAEAGNKAEVARLKMQFDELTKAINNLATATKAPGPPGSGVTDAGSPKRGLPPSDPKRFAP